MLPYCWEIVFEGGHRIRQPLSFKNPFDPQDPPPEYGHPVLVRAIPIDEGFPLLGVDIPIGAKPVFHRAMLQRLGEPRARCLAYRIGYNIDGHRFMKMVDIATLDISEMRDNEGRR